MNANKALRMQRVRAEREANAQAKSNRGSQDHYDQLRIKRISVDATLEELQDFYTTIHGFYLDTSSLILPGEVNLPYPPDAPSLVDARGVPIMTPDPESIAESTFHILELFDPTDPHQRVLQIPIQQCSGYALGFRVLHPGDDPINTVWFTFNNETEELPESIFPVQTNCPHSIAYTYGEIEEVQINNETLRRIFNYFVEFPVNLTVTVDGEMLKNALLIILAEAQRFYFFQRATAIHLFTPEFMPLDGRCDFLIHRWRIISSIISRVWLLQVEEEKGLSYCRTRPKFMDKLEALEMDLQRLADHIAAVVTVRNEHNEFDFASLTGEALLVMKCDVTAVRWLRMRMNGFIGQLVS